jgi:hypothetical protein
MLRMTRSLSVLLLAGAMAPVAANAASLAKLLHLHPGASKPNNEQVSFILFNKTSAPRDVDVDGHTYRLTPNQALMISAPAGSHVTEGADAARSKPATLLFIVDRVHKGSTVYLN